MNLNKEDFLKRWKYGPTRFYEIVWEMCELVEKKNKAYAGEKSLAAFEECERWGLPAWKGSLVRLGDKYSRLVNLVKNMSRQEYQDVIEMERLEDTLLDLANYAVFTLVLLEKETRKSHCGKENCRGCRR